VLLEYQLKQVSYKIVLNQDPSEKAGLVQLFILNTLLAFQNRVSLIKMKSILQLIFYLIKEWKALLLIDFRKFIYFFTKCLFGVGRHIQWRYSC